MSMTLSPTSRARELSVTWTNKGADVETFSNFVMWLEEMQDADFVQKTIVDLTSLLVSQAQLATAEIRAIDSKLDAAHEMQDRASKSLSSIEKRWDVDWKLVTQAGCVLGFVSPAVSPAWSRAMSSHSVHSCTGVEFVNRAKRPFQELEREDEEADAAEAYDSEDDKPADSSAEDMQLDTASATGGPGQERGGHGQGGGEEKDTRPKPKPKKAKQRQAALVL